jgi:hypothetical protein
MQMDVKQKALTWLCLALVIFGSATFAQSDVDQAISFYSAGGSYCFRIVPFGVVMSQELEWTVMVLTNTSNQRTVFKIRDVDAGGTGLRGGALAAAGMTVNNVWRLDGQRAEFFDRFAAGIAAGVLRARVVKAGPANLAQLTSERDRANVYLKFADRGSRVSFDRVPDLTVEQFRTYADYFPD